MSYYDAKRRIDAGDTDAALAWLEEVGSWPSSDADIAALTRKAERVLGWRR